MTPTTYSYLRRKYWNSHETSERKYQKILFLNSKALILSFQDEHNSCPICRHEMPTDDHEYERQKERDREAEEERKGAENALRGGEFMYL